MKLIAKLMLLTLTLSATGCDAQEERPTKPGNHLMPFSISFTLDGKPVLLGEDGRPLESTKLEYPLHATAIERIDSIVMVQAKGSHYKAIILNGVEYHIPLRHK